MGSREQAGPYKAAGKVASFSSMLQGSESGAGAKKVGWCFAGKERKSVVLLRVQMARNL